MFLGTPTISGELKVFTSTPENAIGAGGGGGGGAGGGGGVGDEVVT